MPIASTEKNKCKKVHIKIDRSLVYASIFGLFERVGWKYETRFSKRNYRMLV